MRPDETPASFLNEGVDLSKYFVSGNALNDTTVNLAAAALNFSSPCGINAWVRWTVEFLEQDA